MSKPSESSDAEAAYAKAAKAELARDYDAAFGMYVKAAESFLHLSRSANDGEKGKAKWKANAGKALERAEKIKAFVENSKGTTASGSTSTGVAGGGVPPGLTLTPVGVNPFSLQEQFYVLKRGGLVNGLMFALWDDPPVPPPRPSVSLLYEDPDGQPSLSHEQCKVDPVWRRPYHEQQPNVSSDPSRAQRQLLPHDILQHIVTDCSVCASISVCLEHAQRFSSNLARSPLHAPLQVSPTTPKKHTSNTDQNWKDIQGRYDIKLLFNGAWRRIVIDDKLPYHPTLGILMCMSTAPPPRNRKVHDVEGVEEIVVWPSLLEKAYMKLMGGYDFPGSNSSIDLHAIAGWLPEHIEIKSPTFEREKTWGRVVAGFSGGHCVLTLGTGTGTDIRWQGVEFLASHSYAVIDVREGEEERGLTVLNSWLPSPNVETDEGQDLELSRLLQIPWSDVLNVFDGIYLSWDPSVWAKELVLHGMWKRKGEDEPSSNRHLRVKFQSSRHFDSTGDHEEIWILLTRHVRDIRRSSEYIALRVQTEDDIGTSSTSRGDLNKIATKGTYTNSTHVLVRTRIHTSQVSGALSIFASYDGEFSDVGFTLTVYGGSGMNISWDEDVAKRPFSTKIDGTLTSKNAGGNCAYPTFMINPQFSLRIHSQKATTPIVRPGGKASVVLTMQGGRDVPVNVTVVWSQGERVVELTQKEIVANSGAYYYGLARVGQDLPVGDYTIILSAFEPHHMGSFSLKVESSHQFDLKVIPQEGAGMYSKTVRGAWDEQTAVGGPSFKRYSLNPVFEIHVPVLTQLIARLQLMRHTTTTTINITIYPSSPDGSFGRHITTSGAYDDAISGVATPQISLSPGKYWIVPSTYNPGIQTAFRLIVYSTAAVNVTERKR